MIFTPAGRRRIIARLKRTLDRREFIHTLGAEAESARVLAALGRHDLIARASVAALLHDFAKCMPLADMVALVEKFDLAVPRDKLSHRGLLHGYISAFYAATAFGVDDADVIEAIRNHTLGRHRMTLIEKAIFISDYIEPTRDFAGLEPLRRAVYVALIEDASIDRALLLVMDDKVRTLGLRGERIDPDFLVARDRLGKKLGRK